MAIVKCKGCGSEVDAKLNFCRWCGSSLARDNWYLKIRHRTLITVVPMLLGILLLPAGCALVFEGLSEGYGTLDCERYYECEAQWISIATSYQVGRRKQQNVGKLRFDEAESGLIDTKRRMISAVVPKGRFELPRPCGHYALNVARLPFRHFGTMPASANRDNLPSGLRRLPRKPQTLATFLYGGRYWT